MRRSTSVVMDEPGYSIFEKVIASETCAVVMAAIDNADRRGSRAGARHLLSVPEVWQTANAASMLDIASRCLGRPAIPFKATLFEKSGRMNWLVAWHQDTVLPMRAKFERDGWGPWSVKDGRHYVNAPAWALERVVALRLHLDPSTEENGPLRVIPGTHWLGILDDDQLKSIVQSSEAVTCRVGKGGVLAMSPLIVHASSKAMKDLPRRVLHIEYADSVVLEPGIELSG